jgi:release factor glutamine methyltransferase
MKVLPMDVHTALKEAMRQMREAQVPSHTLAAELLLMHTLGRERAWLYTHPEWPIDADSAEKYFSLVARRTTGEPTQYLTGKQEFWGLEFEVNPNVLIPRPETEHVVEVALERLKTRRSHGSPRTAGRGGELRVADVCTGSGCLAVALARELPEAEVWATDISPGALEVARRNATRHGVAERLHFVEADLLSSFFAESAEERSKCFDLIVSNPPYVGHDEAPGLPREIREHEPHVALFAGASGLGIYPLLIEQAGHLSRPGGGILVLELGHKALGEVRPILDAQGGWTGVAVTDDLAGIPRVISAERA